MLILGMETKVNADEPSCELVEVNSLKINHWEGIQLNVKLERLDRKKIVRKKVNNTVQAWYKGKQVPAALLWTKPTRISSFRLWIDQKEISIPARFWNDIVGVSMHKLKLNSNKPDFKEVMQCEQNLLNPLMRPQVSRSSGRGTVLITWQIPGD